MAADSWGTVLPVESPALVADVACFRLQDFFRWVEESDQSGYVQFEHGAHRKSVYLHRGEVVFAASNQRVDRLGEALLRAGVLTLDQLREAERCFEPPGRFGKVLVERGFLTPRELWNGVKYQVEEIVRSLFVHAAGRITFFEGEVQPDNVVRLALPTRRLVEEGVQRSAELRKFLAVLTGPRVELAVVDGSDAPLAGSERALVEAIERESSFPALCEQLELEPEAAARSVQLLRLVGVVKLVRTPDAPRGGDEAPGDNASLQATLEAGLKLLDQLRHSIESADGSAGIRERLGRAVEDAAVRFPDLLGGVGLDGAGRLEGETLLTRALRLGGDREDQVITALGELIAYLEFELKNQPEIEDPDLLLAELRPARQAFAG